MNIVGTPLIVHVVHRFEIGGLENGVVNLINALPAAQSRHTVIALTESSKKFASRILRNDVEIYALDKRRGRDVRSHVRMYKLLRRLRPDIVHTRNLSTLEYQLAAWLAGVEYRVHGEHGWDVHDPDGTNLKYGILRRLMSPLVDRFVALSEELRMWLEHSVGIPRTKITRICNGVDTKRFRPPRDRGDSATVVIGSVTRFSEIKDPLNTVEAFIRLHAQLRAGGVRMKLVMVGDGPLRSRAQQRICDAGLASDACFPGSAADVVPWLHRMDVFVLGSRREGISNSILEAMAVALPVVATRVGGNAELVVDGVTGALVPPGASDLLASAIAAYVDDPVLRRHHGAAARERAERDFSLNRMVNAYSDLYFASQGGKG